VAADDLARTKPGASLNIDAANRQDSRQCRPLRTAAPGKHTAVPGAAAKALKCDANPSLFCGTLSMLAMPLK
jgi:hypothetical protein